MLKKLTIIFLIIVTGIIASLLYFRKNNETEAAAPKSGLVGWWTMDANNRNGATLYDRSGYDNHITLLNDPTPDIGIMKESVHFTSSSEQGGYVTAGVGSSLKMKGPFTIATWIKTNGGTDSFPTIMGKSLEGQYYLSLTNCEGCGYVQFSTYDNGVGSYWCDGTTYIRDNNWHHVVAIWNGTDLRVYVDGALDGVGDEWSGTIKDENSNFTIAYEGSGTWDYLNGSLDDVRIYNRALSVQEVGQLYRATKINRVNAPSETASSTGGLVGWWTMNKDSVNGTSIYDNSGNNRTLVAEGTNKTIAGKIHEAQYFNGSSDYFSGSPINLPRFTISAWAKPDGSQGGDDAIVFDAYSSGNHINYELYFSGLTIKAGIYNNAVWYRTDTGYTVPADQWSHAVMTYDGANINLYVDGIKRDFKAAVITPQSSGWLFRVGIGYGQFFQGSIDDVRVYNYALSAQEVSNLYNSAKINKVYSAPKDGLVGWWSMDSDDINGTTVYDASDKSNVCISQNGPTATAGKMKEALDFTAASAHWLNCFSNSPATTTLSPKKALTVSAWVRPDSLTNNDFHFIAGTQSTIFAVDGYMLYWSNASPPGVNGMNFAINSWSAGATAAFPLTNAGNGIWYHVVGTYDSSLGSNQTKIYLDGVFQEAASDVSTDIIYPANSLLGIGRVGNAGAYYWNGGIDEVRIYNRALSADEVYRLYQSTNKKNTK